LGSTAPYLIAWLVTAPGAMSPAWIKPFAATADPTQHDEQGRAGEDDRGGRPPSPLLVSELFDYTSHGRSVPLDNAACE
jgi:hypothetical protein